MTTLRDILLDFALEILSSSKQEEDGTITLQDIENKELSTKEVLEQIINEYVEEIKEKVVG